MYACEICGEKFDHPFVRSWKEPREDGWYEPFRQVLCPFCFMPYFEEDPDDE